jgi:uncharacterized protein (DUF488 family)
MLLADHPTTAAAMTLMTIGYEGLDLSTFLAALKANRVTTLVDVRELPLSRKKGFSKSSLAAAVEAAGISYTHVPALGCPRDIRRDYYHDEDWSRYKKRFNAYLRRQRAALTGLVDTAKAGRACLVCFEADYQFCHRSLITAALTATGKTKVKHLRVRGSARAEDRQAAAA